MENDVTEEFRDQMWFTTFAQAMAVAHLCSVIPPTYLPNTMTTQFDRRRIPAPEESRPPVYATAESEAGPSKRDRPADALRPICTSIFWAMAPEVMERIADLWTVLKTGLVTQANGSAYIEAAGVKIACSW